VKCRPLFHPLYLFHAAVVNRLFSHRTQSAPTAGQAISHTARAARIPAISPMKNGPLLRDGFTSTFTSTFIRTIVSINVTVALAIAGSAGAQASAGSIMGEWRADAPLPNGVIQTFRFGPDGAFDLSMALVVDGTYRVDGKQLIETVTLPGAGVTHTDTAAFAIDGDSLIVTELGSAPPRVLHRSGSRPPVAPIVGDWSIVIGKGTAAHYTFSADGTMHVRAQVGDEKGKYSVSADTLRLSNDQTFQLPAIAQFAVTDSVLTLTPSNGKAARHFRKVYPR
jgi:hypothetical protein